MDHGPSIGHRAEVKALCDVSSCQIYCLSAPLLIFFFFFPPLFRTTALAYGSSQARGQIRASDAGLGHGHSNLGSDMHLQPTPELTAMLDPSPTEQGQGLNL